MKAKKQTHSTRKHGLSRLEKLLQDSIRHELQIKALWAELRNRPFDRLDPIKLDWHAWNGAQVPPVKLKPDSA